MRYPAAPTRLRCESFTDPLAIDAARPRLSWIIHDDRRNAIQTAFQVQVASSARMLAADAADLWDSGKVASDQSVHVEYDGRPLASRQACAWRARTWTSTGSVQGTGDDQPSPWSEIATWEMGLPDRADWKGQWIASPIVGGPYSIPPAPYLRKQFDVDADKPIARARLYVTALGMYEFEINGQRVGRDVMAPGRTEYQKRIPYHVYDVTPLLNNSPRPTAARSPSKHANVLGAILGDGWYCGHLHSDPRMTYGDRPRLLAQLIIDYADGTTQTIATDSTWRTAEGPIRSSDMLMGEDYDARLEIPRWSTPKFDAPSHAQTPDENWDAASFPRAANEAENWDAASFSRAKALTWRPVVTFEDPGIALVAHRAPPMRAVRELKPVKPPTATANRRRHIFDFGQNMVGRVRLRVRNAPAGKTIDLRHVEMLDKEGKPYVLALRTARAIDHYTTRGPQRREGEAPAEPWS
jgi:alpha-L-rhamnosidase